MKIDDVQAIDLLEKAVEVGGLNHVVDECTYFNSATGAPNCVVGTALDIAGIDVPQVFAGINSDKIDKILYELKQKGVEFSTRALRIFKKAQEEQDLQVSWGDAVEAARKIADSA